MTGHQLKSGPLCVICEFVMKEVDNLIQGNKTEVCCKGWNNMYNVFLIHQSSLLAGFNEACFR